MRGELRGGAGGVADQTQDRLPGAGRPGKPLSLTFENCIASCCTVTLYCCDASGCRIDGRRTPPRNGFVWSASSLSGDIRITYLSLSSAGTTGTGLHGSALGSHIFIFIFRKLIGRKLFKEGALKCSNCWPEESQVKSVI